MINIIIASSTNDVIGKDNSLPWYLPADLKYFKELTTNNVIIMGRKTYESIGKPLPNRISIVITRNSDYMKPEFPDNVIICHSIGDAITLAKEKNKEIFIIGGADIIKQSLSNLLVDRIYLTRIHENFEGDTFLDPIHEEDWIETNRIDLKKDEKNKYDYSFITLEKNEC